MGKRSAFYPCPAADTAGRQVVSQAGGLLLTETVRAVRLDRELASALAPWRLPNTVHDPAKILLDLAVALAVGGDCLADIAVLRAEPGVYGRWPRTRRCRALLIDVDATLVTAHSDKEGAAPTFSC